MSRMKSEDKVFRCSIHANGAPGSTWPSTDCEGALITRESIYGAVTRACEKGWSGFDMAGWPSVRYVEEG